MDKKSTCQNCGERGGVFHDPSKLYEHEAHCHSTTPTPPAGRVDAVAEAANRFAGIIIKNTGGHTLCNTAGDILVSSREPINITHLIKASGAEHIAGLVGALEGIAANGCCDTCQEAKLVAQHALEALPPELRGK